MPKPLIINGVQHRRPFGHGFVGTVEEEAAAPLAPYLIDEETDGWIATVDAALRSSCEETEPFPNNVSCRSCAALRAALDRANAKLLQYATTAASSRHRGDPK